MTAAALEGGVSVASAPSGRSLGWWGTVFAILTEGMLFALLLFGYFSIRAAATDWPPGEIKEPELFMSGIRTVLLLGSSIPMHFADRGFERGSQTRLKVGMALALVMASVFLAGHVEEYVRLWREFRPGTNAYGSAFYTITALHALHLVVGMGLVAFVLWRALWGRISEGNRPMVKNAALYWHFVDGVWIAVYSSLYLSVTLL